VSTPAGQPPGLPRGISIAALLCLVLSGLTGMGAAMEAANVAHLSELKEQAPRNMAVFGDPVVFERTYKAQLSALEPMRDSRTLVLGALAVACALVFVSAGRMLRPGGLPRDGMRRMLGWTALAAAILRVIDGAQWRVVVERYSAVMAEAMGTLPELQDPAVAEQLQSLLPTLMEAATIAHTAFIAGAFVLLGQYFQSERVREAVLATDGVSE
jgi:hypothetical protein